MAFYCFESFHLLRNLLYFNLIIYMCFHFNFKEKHLKIVQIGRNFHFYSIIGPNFHHALLLFKVERGHVFLAIIL